MDSTGEVLSFRIMDVDDPCSKALHKARLKDQPTLGVAANLQLRSRNQALPLALL